MIIVFKRKLDKRTFRVLSHMSAWNYPFLLIEQYYHTGYRCAFKSTSKRTIYDFYHLCYHLIHLQCTFNKLRCNLKKNYSSTQLESLKIFSSNKQILLICEFVPKIMTYG